MEKAVEAVYNIEIIEKFLKTFHLEASYKLFGDFENYVYEVTKEGKFYILRITHSTHRNEDEIKAEIDWIQHLQRNGANVPVIYPSKNHNVIEKQVAEDNSVFYACLFSKVIGNPINARDEHFNDNLFTSWGREIGKMHRITAEYRPGKLARKKWFEDDLFEVEKYIPEEKLVIKRTKEIIDSLKELPEQDFGLIHNDIHIGNFFYDGEDIHIFDFDDACYFWYVSDIAIPLYYSCYVLFRDNSSIEERKNFANKFLNAFMKGYSTEMNPPRDWEKLLPLFLKVRDVTLYAALNKKIAPENRNVQLQRSMKLIKDRIERDQAIVSIT